MIIRKKSENYKSQFSKLVGKILVLKGTINNSRAFLSLAFLYRRLKDYQLISRIAELKSKNTTSLKNIRSAKTDHKILVLKGTINNGRVFPSLAFLYRGLKDYQLISRIAKFTAKKKTSLKNIRSVKTDRKILVLKGTINNGRVFPDLAFSYRGFWDFKWISNRRLKDYQLISRIAKFTAKKKTSLKNIRSVKTDRKILVLKGTINNGRVFPDLAFSYRGFWDFKWISNRRLKDYQLISRIVKSMSKKKTSLKNIRSVKTDRRILVLKGTINNGRVFPDLAFSSALNLN